MNRAIRRLAGLGRLAFGLLIGAFLVSLADVWAAEDAGLASSGNTAPVRIILIGAERYFKADNLVYVVNDVRQVSQSLVSRGGLSPANILEMIDTAPTARFQPLRQSILDEVPRWLAKVGKDDQVIVYFTGHGYRAPDGTLYLAPLDIDPDKPAETGVAVSWLRKLLEDCPAQFKLLIIDACHAGAEKAFGDTPPVTAKDLAQSFEQVAGVVTLAAVRRTNRAGSGPTSSSRCSVIG
jgi:uncharacterized caspase-like protein